MSDTQLVEFILGLLPCIFKRKDGESGRPHHGIISQDFEELMKKLGLRTMLHLLNLQKQKKLKLQMKMAARELKYRKFQVNMSMA